MDNREFTKVLLYEASELLESSGRNGLAKRIYEEKYGKDNPKEREKERNKISVLRTHSISKEMDKKLDKRDEDLDMDESNRRLLGKHDAYNSTSADISRGRTSIRGINGYGTDNDRAKYLDIALDMVEGKNRLNSERASRVNKNINRRAQNESIAILLTEAALLLNEDLGTLTQSQLRVYNDKNFLIPDEKDDDDRDTRRAEGAKKLTKLISEEKKAK